MTTQIPPTTITSLGHLAAAVDPYPESQDATVLAAALAAAAGGELMLLAVEPDLPLVIPGLQRARLREETEAMLRQTRDQLAPAARLKVTSDLFVSRGLHRLAAENYRNLVVVGSGRHGAIGEVSIGSRTRQLIEELGCAVAIAPRGLRQRGPLELRRIGVGYDGGPEARDALTAARQLATGARAELIVRAVIDDRVPALGWPEVWVGAILRSWEEMLAEDEARLRTEIEELTADVDVRCTVQLERGRPADSLQALSADVDLLVLGSRRWGPLARLVLGGTGEHLAHGSRCSLLIVPRPPAHD